MNCLSSEGLFQYDLSNRYILKDFINVAKLGIYMLIVIFRGGHNGSIILVFLTRPHRFVIVTIDIDRNGFTTSVVLIIVPKIKNVIKSFSFFSE